MNTNDVINLLNNTTGSHLDEIYVPSIGKTILFKPLSTADVKTLTRMSFIQQFDLNVELMKLALFDNLCTQDLSETALTDQNGNIIRPAISSKTITQIDYLSFLIGLRQMLDNSLTYTFTCSNSECKKSFQKKINLDEQFMDTIYQFKPQQQFFQMIDTNTNFIWKFQLTNFTMHDYLYFRYMMNKLQQADKENPDVLFEMKFVKPILYIKNIWLNDELISDWPTLTLPNKLVFFNKIPPNITINMPDNSKSDNLYTFIRKTFMEQKFDDKIDEMVIECPHCNKKYRGMFTFENFFIF